MLELALHILDVLENTVEAGATCVGLTIEEDHYDDRLTLRVIDNGRGMDARTLARVLDPFYTTRTTRHVGLGLPLLAQAAERADGELVIRSQPGQGTELVTTFRLSHPDRQPLGDVAGTLLAFLLTTGAPELRFSHRVRPADPSTGELLFEFDTTDIRAELDGLPFGHPAVAGWLREFLKEGESTLCPN